MNENSVYVCLLHYVHVSGYAALLIVSRIPLHEAMAEILCLNTQVHEKSILLPLMPVMLLGPDQPILTRWLPPVACFSMYPLLKKDDLILAYLALQLLWGSQTWPSGKKKGREGQTESSTDQAGSSRDHRQERAKAMEGGADGWIVCVCWACSGHACSTTCVAGTRAVSLHL